MTLLTPEYLQTKKYTASRDRATLAHGGPVQAGAWGAGDYKVSTTSGMTVAAAAGAALVNPATGVGLYHVTNDAAVNVSLSAAHASLPRIDQVYLLVNDSTDQSSGSDIPVIQVATGTATSGTTLDTRVGAASLPGNSLRLADILVPGGSSSVTAGNIRDRRPWARGAFYTAGMFAGSPVTSSATPSSIQATFDFRLETSGNPIRLSWAGVGKSDTLGAQCSLSPRVNGASIHQLDFNEPAANSNFNTSFSFVSGAVGAGSNVFSNYFFTSAGTFTLIASGATGLVWTVEEIVRPVALNV